MSLQKTVEFKHHNKKLVNTFWGMLPRNIQLHKFQTFTRQNVRIMND